MALSTPLEPKSSTNHMDWEEYVMAIAFLAAKRSKDPRTQVGACLVNEDKRIVGIGYNAMPRGCSDDEFPWVKNTDDPLNCKFSYVAHAELNAIVNKSFTDKNCTLYVTHFPCEQCAGLIIQSGIKKIVYGSNKCGRKRKATTSKSMLKDAGIEFQEYTRKRQNIVIDFTEVDGIQHESLTSTSKRISESADVETQQYIPKGKRDEIEGIQLPCTPSEKDPHGI